jgi:hypothetical protein
MLFGGHVPWAMDVTGGQLVYLLIECFKSFLLSTFQSTRLEFNFQLLGKIIFCQKLLCNNKHKIKIFISELISREKTSSLRRLKLKNHLIKKVMSSK